TGANDLPVANMVAHALAGGLAAEAVGGDFAAGAASGLASSVAANAGLFDGLSPEQIAKVSEVIGGTAALLAGGDARDVNQGATTSQSAALNNYLTHAQIKEFEADLKACGKNAECKVDVTHKFVKLSEQQNADLANCGTLDCIKWHSQRIQEARAASNEILNPYIQADPRYTVQLASLQSPERISASTHVALARVQARSDAVETCGNNSTCVERETSNRFETWARQQENKEIIAAAFGVATAAVGIIRGGKVQIVTPEKAPNRGLPDNGIDYRTISTAKPNQATTPRNLTEQAAWNGILENPSAGRPLNLSNDPRFRPEDGFQKMETSTITDSGQRVTIHYQYNSNTGQPYDIKIVYPPNP
ncbi:MAG: VENN motif pre-toxin domain-containing protein, partial [Pseudomonadota bacterium]